MNRSITSLLLLFISLQTVAKVNLTWQNLSQEQYIDNLVECKTTLDEIKWSHNLWPKQNKTPKPKFADVVDKDSIRQSVENSIKMQAVLADTFNFEITPEMLQHDMDRMARNTKDAKRLKEMFAVLGNDAETIAQCISRPYLVQKKLTNQFNYNNTIHAEIKLTAQTELDNYLQSNNTDDTTAQVHTVTFKIKTDEEKDLTNEITEEIIIELDEEEFSQKLKQLENTQLQEQETAFTHTQILEENQDSIKIQVLQWQKQKQHVWMLTQSDRQYFQMQNTQKTYKFSLPSITGSGTLFNVKSTTVDSWDSKVYVPDGREFHSAIWSGTEMIVWGGSIGSSANTVNTGGRYNPSSDSWLFTSLDANVPTGRYGHTAIWSGSEMIVWGGYNGSNLNTGGRYDPINNSWVATSVDSNTPVGRNHHTAIWSGTEMIVWGGYDGSDLNTGGRYDPVNNVWQSTSIGANVSTGRHRHTAIWSGSEMIVWGGYDGSFLNTGGRYNPSSDSWSATSIGANVPTGRYYHTAIWSGTEMIVWGGYDSSNTKVITGGRYNPINDSWIATSIGANVPAGRTLHTAIWTGTEMIVWSGNFASSNLNTGGRYNPVSDSWSSTSVGTNVPTARYLHTAIWSGTEMIVWGGSVGSSSNTVNTGGRYNPSSDSWSATSIGANVSTGRYRHTAIWSGSEMIVWGGYGGGNTGARYDPSSDSWLPTSLTNVPAFRVSHIAIWSGTEMIVWGGVAGIVRNTGGRYDPINDSWIATSLGANVPTGRWEHSAIWSGSEMIIWGGFDGTRLNTGGRYNPVSDSWVATSVGTNVPAGRSLHSAIWSGSEMIVWGGFGGSPLNTGGRYNPVNDSWIATSVGANTPNARRFHTAIWSGSEMIIWGGLGGSPLNTGGRYNPVNDSWIATSVGANTPNARRFHTAIWSGSEMIIWGGLGGSPLNTGGRYDPSSDSWLYTTASNAPIGRSFHTAVWTGSEMIIWGGSIYGVYMNSMGIYSMSTSYDISGTLSGLNGNQVIIQNNAGDDLTLTADGAFTFPNQIVEGGSYTVTVLTNPSSPNQTCTVINGTGTNIMADFSNVQVVCTNNTFNVNITVTGLAPTNFVTFANGSDILSLTANSTGTISTLADGAAYGVLVFAQPNTPNQTCSFTSANTGNITGADVNIMINCVTIMYDINVTVTGLAAGNSISLANGGDTLTLNANATGTISTLDDGSAYSVSISTQPNTPNQTCSFININFGNLAGTDVTTTVVCTTNQYFVGGSVTGLASGNSVTLMLGGQSLVVTGNTYVFTNPLVDESNYAVTVGANPTSPNQTCTIANSTGQITGADIVNVDITCVTNQYTIGGTVTGMLAGSPNTMVLQNNNGDDLIINNDGSFVFSTPIDDETTYSVSVFLSPNSPIQNCTVVNGSGIVAGNDVVNVLIDCHNLIYKNGFE